LQPNIACLLAYLFSLVGGLVILAIEKQNRFVRYNALQAFCLGIIIFAINIIFTILGFTPLWFITVWFSWLFWLAYVGLMIYLIVQSMNGKLVKLPVLQDFVEKNYMTFLR
jgi:uncharacterized membrane protein